MKKKISVIIPVYNAGKYLRLCLDSVINQTYKELEIIIVNDGSTDTSWEIISEYAARDTRIKAINQKNQGQSTARNNALKIATGDYYLFVDSDDYIVRDMIETLYKNLINYQADISVCAIRRSTENAHKEMQLKSSEEIEVADAMQCVGYAMDWNHFYTYSPCNKLFRAELFENITFAVGRIYEDIYLNFELLTKAKKIVLNNSEKYIQIIKDTNSTTAAPFSRKHLDRLYIADRSCELLDRCFPEMTENTKLFRLFNYIKVVNKIYESVNSYPKEEKEILHEIVLMWKTIDRKALSTKKKMQVEVLIHFPCIYKRMYRIKNTNIKIR